MTIKFQVFRWLWIFDWLLSIWLSPLLIVIPPISAVALDTWSSALGISSVLLAFAWWTSFDDFVVSAKGRAVSLAVVNKLATSSASLFEGVFLFDVVCLCCLYDDQTFLVEWNWNWSIYITEKFWRDSRRWQKYEWHEKGVDQSCRVTRSMKPRRMGGERNGWCDWNGRDVRWGIGEKEEKVTFTMLIALLWALLYPSSSKADRTTQHRSRATVILHLHQDAEGSRLESYVSGAWGIAPLVHGPGKSPSCLVRVLINPLPLLGLY